MKSMTGYGWGECVCGGWKITAELSSVNRKQSEITTILPRELEVLEAQARDLIGRQISRGRVTARIALHAGEGRESVRTRINAKLARAYAEELNKLARELKLAGPVSLDVLIRAPGVLEANEELGDAEQFWPGIETALKDALAKLIRVREREGANLRKDLTGRIDALRKSVARVKKLAPKVQLRFREQLLERIRAAGITDPELDQDRIHREVVFFADRSDVSEELTRLESHFQQFQDCLKSGEPVGRMLDFLAQEMNREINTLGSKANSSEISKEVVLLKTELEKFREQAQNVE